MSNSYKYIAIILAVLCTALIALLAFVFYMQDIQQSSQDYSDDQSVNTTPKTISTDQHKSVSQTVSSVFVSTDTDVEDLATFVSKICDTNTTKEIAYDRLVKIANYTQVSPETLSKIIGKMPESVTKDNAQKILIAELPSVDTNKIAALLCGIE